MNNAYVTIINSVLRPSVNYFSSYFYIYDVNSVLNVYDSIFSGSWGPGISLIDAATVNVINSVFYANGLITSGRPNISGECSNVKLLNVFSPNNWSLVMDNEISAGFSDTWPGLKSGTRSGIISIAVDDTGNWQYVQDIAVAINPLGAKITFYCHTRSLPIKAGKESDTMKWADIKRFLDAGNDIACHSSTHPAGIGTEGGAVNWDIEVTGAKAALEAYIRQTPGYSDWNCIIWGSPGNGGSLALADRIKQDGFKFGRMGSINLSNSYRLDNLSIFSVRPIANAYVKTASDEQAWSPDNIHKLCAFLEEMGGYGDLYFHNPTSFYDPEPENFVDLVKYIHQHNVSILTPRELVAYLESNASYTDGPGNAARYSLTWAMDRFNRDLRPEYENDGDSDQDGIDLQQFILSYNPFCKEFCTADLNKDGMVNLDDIAFFAAGFGAASPL